MISFRQKIYGGVQPLPKPETITAPPKAIKPMPTPGVSFTPPEPAPYLNGDVYNHPAEAQALANQRATTRLTEKAEAKLSTLDEKTKLVMDRQMQKIRWKQQQQQQKALVGQKSALFL